MISNLAETLKERRKSKNLTLTQLATVSGVSCSHLARIEKKERSPSGHVLSKIAKPLGFTEIELLSLAGYIPNVESGRLAKLKNEIKMEIAITMSNLLVRIENL